MKTEELQLDRLLFFDKEGGRISFMGHRVMLVDVRAFGLLRKELIDQLGVSVARTVFTRAGYAHGWLVADDLSVSYPELLQDPLTGPALHRLMGLVAPRDVRINDDEGPVNINATSIWEGSFEAEQHLIHLGISDEPVCWLLAGFVSGWISRVRGKETYSIEIKCRGKGDAVCQIESRTREGWGDMITDQLRFFERETIDDVLKDLTARLRKSEKQLSRLKRLLDTPLNPSGIITKNETMLHQIDLAKRAAKVNSSIIITGESGVGKELLARFIHDESARAGKPFVAINCGAITETLLESEFFGHSKGAFTGAESERAGLFEAANGGTILLDEIGEMPASMQTKLLRVLQEKEVRRVGENKSRPVDVKVIAATNRDLEDDVQSGRFRRDLFYRLCVIELTVPPLRDRVEDILPLARFYLEKTARSMNRTVETFSPGAAEHLLAYSWPGNVRELRNVIERAIALTSGATIQADDLPRGLRREIAKPKGPDEIRPLAQMERNYILSTLEMMNGNKSLTAEKLGIGLASLYRKLKEYNVQ